MRLVNLENLSLDRRLRLALFAITLAVAACGTAASVPSGAQLLHVSVDGRSIRVEPARGLHAGQIYVVLETLGPSVTFVQSQRTADGPPEPLNDDDLARLAAGDLEHTRSEAFGPICVGPDGEAGRGQLVRSGGCGNVFSVVVRAGRYAFLTGDLAGASPGSLALAVFEVLP